MSFRGLSVGRKRKKIGSGSTENPQRALAPKVRNEDDDVPLGRRIAPDIWMQVLPFTNYKTVQAMREVSILYGGVVRQLGDRTPRCVVYSLKMNSDSISDNWPFVRDISSAVTHYEHNVREYFEEEGVKSWANARNMPATIPRQLLGKRLNRAGGHVTIGVNLYNAIKREFFAQFYAEVSITSWPIFQYFSSLIRSPNVYFKNLHLETVNIKALELTKMDWMASKIECNQLSLRHKPLNDHNRMQPWLSENIVADKVNIVFCSPNFTEPTAKALAYGFLRMGKWVRRKADVNALSMDIVVFMIREFQELSADDSRHIVPLMEIAKGRFTAQYFHSTFSANCVTEETGSVLGSAALYYRFCNLSARRDILVSIVPNYGYSKVYFERVDCIH